MPESPWDILHITPSATEAEIKKAYAALAKQNNPEDNPEAFRKIHEAYKAAITVCRMRQQNKTVVVVQADGSKIVLNPQSDNKPKNKTADREAPKETQNHFNFDIVSDSPEESEVEPPIKADTPPKGNCFDFSDIGNEEATLSEPLQAEPSNIDFDFSSVKNDNLDDQNIDPQEYFRNICLEVMSQHEGQPFSNQEIIDMMLKYLHRINSDTAYSKSKLVWEQFKHHQLVVDAFTLPEFEETLNQHKLSYNDAKSLCMCVGGSSRTIYDKDTDSYKVQLDFTSKYYINTYMSRIHRQTKPSKPAKPTEPSDLSGPSEAENSQASSTPQESAVPPQESAEPSKAVEPSNDAESLKDNTGNNADNISNPFHKNSDSSSDKEPNTANLLPPPAEVKDYAPKLPSEFLQELMTERGLIDFRPNHPEDCNSFTYAERIALLIDTLLATLAYIVRTQEFANNEQYYKEYSDNILVRNMLYKYDAMLAKINSMGLSEDKLNMLAKGFGNRYEVIHNQFVNNRPIIVPRQTYTISGEKAKVFQAPHKLAKVSPTYKVILERRNSKDSNPPSEEVLFEDVLFYINLLNKDYNKISEREWKEFFNDSLVTKAFDCPDFRTRLSEVILNKLPAEIIARYIGARCKISSISRFSKIKQYRIVITKDIKVEHYDKAYNYVTSEKVNHFTFPTLQEAKKELADYKSGKHLPSNGVIMTFARILWIFILVLLILALWLSD